MSTKTIGILVSLVILIGIGIFAIYTNPALMEKASAILGHKQTEKKISVPIKEEINTLVQESMQNFALSLNKNDMTDFYNTLSPFWQDHTSIDKLNKDFDPFIKAGIDLTPLKKMQPIIDKSGLNKRKDLMITGHYNTKPHAVRFQQTYQHQKDGKWKLVEFFIEIK